MVALALMVFAGIEAWCVVRGWGRPYVVLNSRRLVVFERGRTKHDVQLSLVAAARSGFNSTVLEMRDGSRISIGDFSFMHGEDSRRFRAVLQGMLAADSAEQGAPGNAGIALCSDSGALGPASLS